MILVSAIENHKKHNLLEVENKTMKMHFCQEKARSFFYFIELTESNNLT